MYFSGCFASSLRVRSTLADDQRHQTAVWFCLLPAPALDCQDSDSQPSIKHSTDFYGGFLDSPSRSFGVVQLRALRVIVKICENHSVYSQSIPASLPPASVLMSLGCAATLYPAFKDWDVSSSFTLTLDMQSCMPVSPALFTGDVGASRTVLVRYISRSSELSSAKCVL